MSKNQKDNGIRTSEYKGFTGSVLYIDDDGAEEVGGVYFGKLLDIRDVVFYEAADLDGVQKAFEEAVDEYLEILQEYKMEK